MNGVRPSNIARAVALIISSAALALAALACEDAAPPTTPAPIAAATAAVPTNAPAPPTAAPTNAPSPPTAVPTGTPAPPAAVPTAAEAQRIYDDAVDAISALSSYRVQATEILDLGMGNKSRISMDLHFQTPDMRKTKMTVGIGAQTPIEMEDVSIGGYSYMKTSGNPFYEDPNAGKWMRESGGSGSLDEYLSNLLLSALYVDAAVGTERLDGVETVRLKGSAYSSDLGFGMTSISPESILKADIWIGMADGLIRRITAATSPGAPEGMEITAVFSDFDIPVAIEAPKDYIERDDALPPAAPTAAEVETTTLSSGWTRAYLPEYGFSVSTPPGWGLFDSGGEMYFESDNYFANRAPEEREDLKVSSAPILATSHFLVPFRIAGHKAESAGGETHLSTFIVNIMGVLEDAELTEYVDERLEQTKAAFVINGAIERSRETLPAGEAEVAEFAFRFAEVLGMELDDDTDYAQIQYFILSEGSAFILTFVTAADRIDAMRPSFAEIAQTARIEPRL